jgi:hypothetical protein
MYVSFLYFSQMIPSNQIILFLEHSTEADARWETDSHLSHLDPSRLKRVIYSKYENWTSKIFSPPPPRFYIKSDVGYTIP